MATSTAARRTIVVSSADAQYFELLQDMILSLRQTNAGTPFAIGIYDLGLTAAQQNWLRSYTDLVVTPRWHFEAPESEKTTRNLSYVARPFLYQYFPGFDVYAWIDADVWLQEPNVLGTFVEGAWQTGAAVARENEPSYRLQPWLFLWTTKHFLSGYGLVHGTRLLAQPHINTGLFAMRADAPHWALWTRCYQDAITRSGVVMPHDQFALNEAIYRHNLPTKFLSASYNWICDRGIPVWDEVQEKFCEPSAPHNPISVLHLAGPGKRNTYRLKTVLGRHVQTTFRYKSAKLFEEPLRHPAEPGSLAP
jgi:hypothetical protein